MIMRIFLLIFLIFIGLFLSGCDNLDIGGGSQEDVIVCPENYIRFGSSCCLDKNANGICDKDEKEEEKLKESCEDECSSDSCSGLDYTECLMKSDGCKDKVVKGKVVGKCGVECITNEGCGTGELCTNYKCIEEEKSEPDIVIFTSKPNWKEPYMEDLGDNQFKVLDIDNVVFMNTITIYNKGDQDVQITSSEFTCNNELGQMALWYSDSNYHGITFEDRKFGCGCEDYRCEVKNPTRMGENPCEWGERLDKIYRNGKANFLYGFKFSDKFLLPATLVCTFKLYWVGGEDQKTLTYHFRY